jgi:hypothetical protein
LFQKGRWKTGRSPSHPQNAECRLSTAPSSGCGLPRTANLRQVEAQRGDLQSLTVFHRHGTVRRRTTGRSSVLSPAATLHCFV